MEVERRGWIDRSCELVNSTEVGDEPMIKAKSFCISKQVVWEAYKRVKANKGAAGVDSESLSNFEVSLGENLYKIWNRMSSGSYFPPPVRAVDIEKPGGGQRRLGIPTVSDRIAQMVVKIYFEPHVEPYFHPDSYGYRSGKSALDAVGQARIRCWRYSWVLDLDIKGFFDNIDHGLMMRAVTKHTDCKWIRLYVERWLKAPMEMRDGEIITRERGTPQGGVISPLLANLFLHYAFDEWMRRENASIPFERYADDIIVHCKSGEQANWLRAEIEKRLRDCMLELHPEKTQIVYCKSGRRQGMYDRVAFDFLGYTFMPRRAMDRQGGLFLSFSPAVSRKSVKSMHCTMRAWHIPRRTGIELADISRIIAPAIRGWINYYGKYRRSALASTFHHLNKLLIKWAMKKYKKFRDRRWKAIKWLSQIARREPGLFPHWQYIRPVVGQ